MKTNIIVLISLINSLIMMGNMSELSAQEDVLSGQAYEPAVIPDNGITVYEAEPVVPVEENPDAVISAGSEATPVVNEATPAAPVEEKPNAVISTGNEATPAAPVEEKPNAVVATGNEATPVVNEAKPVAPVEGKPNETLITGNQELNGGISPTENGKILPSTTHDPPVVPTHLETVEKLQPAVQPTTANAAALAGEPVQPATIQAVDGECNNPAIYFNDIREAHLPAVEVPLYIDITGQPISSIGLFAVKLRIPFGFSDFELKEAVFKEILINHDPCNAQFIPETGILNIPQVEIPTLIAAIDSTQPQVGPVIKCSAVLQQSNIRISVLSLKEIQCDPPL
jgi:hypothetical protein